MNYIDYDTFVAYQADWNDIYHVEFANYGYYVYFLCGQACDTSPPPLMKKRGRGKMTLITCVVCAAEVQRLIERHHELDRERAARGEEG